MKRNLEILLVWLGGIALATAYLSRSREHLAVDGVVLGRPRASLTGPHQMLFDSFDRVSAIRGTSLWSDGRKLISPFAEYPEVIGVLGQPLSVNTNTDCGYLTHVLNYSAQGLWVEMFAGTEQPLERSTLMFVVLSRGRRMPTFRKFAPPV